MAINWGDRPHSVRSTSNPQSVTVGYVLTGTASRTIAQLLASGYAPVIHSSLYRSNIALDHLGASIWNVDVTYGPYEKKEKDPGDFKWSFDTSGRTKHVAQGYAHIKSYVPTGGKEADHKGAIGLTENGAEGVDVPDKTFSWTEDWSLLTDQYSFSYATILGELTGGINDGSFRGFPANTVRFDGASGGQSAKDMTLLEVSFKFSVSPSEQNFLVGDILVKEKLGWDHASICYEQKEGLGLPKRTYLQPTQVDIDRVLRVVDFSLLGIGW